MPKKRIFIIGQHRSGTTWLTNGFAEIEGVFTPQLELHHGQIESAFFSSLVPYFNQGKTPVDRIALYTAFAQTDFFKALGISHHDLQLDATPAQAFATVMDLAAEKHDSDTWIEKSPGNSLMIDELMVQFPESHFIRVRRNLYEQCTSRAIGLLGGLNLKTLFLSGVQAGLYDNVMSGQSKNLHEVRYEDLVADYDREMERCLAFVGLQGRIFKRPTVKPNSSYSSAYSNVKDRKKANLTQKFVIVFGYASARLIPRNLVVKALALRKRFFRNRLPVWLYATLENRNQGKVTHIMQSKYSKK